MAVETALVMPLMIFFALGIVQLTMIEHAKLMTEYAAFQAARAGIVWNGHNERMHDAAMVALLPTMGRTDSLPMLGQTFLNHEVVDAALANFAVPGPRRFNGSPLFALVRVDTVNPSEMSPIDSIWKLRDGANWKELDFDGADGYPEVPGLERHLASFFNVNVPDTQEATYRRATVLQIRLRYLYELRVPFANQIIFVSWYATNADVVLSGAIDRATTARGQNMLNRQSDVSALGAQGRGFGHQKGYASMQPAEMQALWSIGHGDVGVLGQRFFLPLTATYSMRMQSAFHRKWIMHVNPAWGL